MRSLRASFLGAATAALAACSGQLLVDSEALPDPICRDVVCPEGQRCVAGTCEWIVDPCIGRTDNECGPCNPTNLVGTCPEGLLCLDGVCETPPTLCEPGIPGDCPEGETCNANGCGPLPIGDRCTPANPDGLCPDDDRCVFGFCYPADTVDCSLTNPVGLCPAGEWCVQGECYADSSSCSEFFPEGTCPGWLVCVRGDCVGPVPPDACTVDNPLGRCPTDEVCIGGTCTPIVDDNVCSLTNPTGLCPAGAACDAGRCIEVTTTNGCSPSNPSGFCANGATCQGGVCVQTSCQTGGYLCQPGYWCSASNSCLPLLCDPVHPEGLCLDDTLVCDQGVCDEPTCSLDVPDGECPLGLSCIDGACQEQPCSLEFPGGACPPGDLCMNGACVEGPCAPTNLDGVCEGDAQTCKPSLGCGVFVALTCCDDSLSSVTGCNPGTCAAPACAPDQPDGICPLGFFCNGGTCEVAPCGNFFPDGVCPANEVCFFGSCRKTGCVGQPASYCDPFSCDVNLNLCVTGSCSPGSPDGLCALGEVCCNNTYETDYACTFGECFVPPCDVPFPGGSCPNANQICVGTGCIEPPCTSSFPDGVCGPNFACNEGVCEWLPCGPGAPLGYCQAGERCESEQCEPYVCSPIFPSGPCPVGTLCQGNTCVTPACSSSYPGGACSAGEVCAGGTCVPQPCSSQFPNGRCASGFDCQFGVCQPLPCGPGATSGACPIGEVCVDDGVTVACTPYQCGLSPNGFATGPCPLGQICETSEPGCAAWDGTGPNPCCIVPDCSTTYIGGACTSPQICVPSAPGCAAWNGTGPNPCCIMPACSGAVPNGQCPGNQICCDSTLSGARGCSVGTCVLQACSTTYPDGYCPSGDKCNGTSCVPFTCANFTGGPCPSGQICVGTSCQVPECSATYIGGACFNTPGNPSSGINPNQVCTGAGGCVSPACSPSVPSGSCPTNQICCDSTLSGSRGCPIGVCVVEDCADAANVGYCPPGGPPLNQAQRCVGTTCLPYICGPDFPAGPCPAGQQCIGNTCVMPECSPTNIGGACFYVAGDPGSGIDPDQVCAGGACRTPACSPSFTNGACPANQICCDAALVSSRGCVEGTCVLGDCSPANTSGRCPSGEICCSPALQTSGFCPDPDLGGPLPNPLGSCVDTTCSVQFPLGACPPGEVCVSGVCEDPCSTTQRLGWCPSSFTCVEGACAPGCTNDADCDLILDTTEGSGTNVDTDGDGSPDYLDRDSDGDVIPDSVERGPGPAPRDSDSDGIGDFRERDSDNDHVSDTFEAGPAPAAPRDFDADGFPDYGDTDSDNDGISDRCEFSDIDGLCLLGGILDLDVGRGPGLILDSDGDGKDDYLDRDSDDDGISDCIEGLLDPRLYAGNCNNGIASQAGPSGSTNHDGTGVADYRDLDSDGDGVNDADEDVNGDGIVNCQVNGSGQPVADPRSTPVCGTTSAPFSPSFPYNYNPGCPSQKCLLAESSRIHTDSDGDLILDGADGNFLVCSTANLKPINLFYSRAADYAFALEQSYNTFRTLTRGGVEAGMAFANNVNGDGSYGAAGFILERVPSASVRALAPDPDPDRALIEKAIAQEAVDRAAMATATGVSSVALVINRNFTSFDGYGVLLSRYLITTSSSITLRLLRDRLAQALDTGVTGYSLAAAGPAGTSFTLTTETLYRYDTSSTGRVIVIGALAVTGTTDTAQTYNYRTRCSTQSLGTCASRVGCQVSGSACVPTATYQIPLFFADNITNGSAVTQFGDDLAALCQSMIQEYGKLDFLWVVDDSGSMNEEITQVMTSARLFFGIMNNTEADYRVSQVTTYENRSDWAPTYDFAGTTDEANRQNGALIGGFTGAIAGQTALAPADRQFAYDCSQNITNCNSIYCPQVTSNSDCNGHPACVWDGSCIGCTDMDQAQCTGNTGCSWNGTSCDYAVNCCSTCPSVGGGAPTISDPACYFASRLPIATGRGQEFGMLMGEWAAFRAGATPQCTGSSDGTCEAVDGCMWVPTSPSAGYCMQGYCAGEVTQNACSFAGASPRPVASCRAVMSSSSCSTPGSATCQNACNGTDINGDTVADCEYYNPPNNTTNFYCVSRTCRYFGSDEFGGSSGDCGSHPACTWTNPTGGSNSFCNDDNEGPSYCQRLTYEGQTACDTDASCGWRSVTGTTYTNRCVSDACAAHTSSGNCGSSPDCSWRDPPGSGNSYCDDTAEAPILSVLGANKPAGCEWDPNTNTCDPSVGFRCNTYTTQGTCDAQGPRCSWDSGSSRCRPNETLGTVLCNSTTQATCDAQGGGFCEWDAGGFCRPPVNYAFRSDATRSLVMLSDEEDCYVKDRASSTDCPYDIGPNARYYDDPVRLARVDSYTQFLQARGFTVYGIVGDKASEAAVPGTSNGGCATAQSGNGYIEVAESTGGGWGSICAADLFPTIEAIVISSIAKASPYVLEGFIDGQAVQPIASTIKVAVEVCDNPLQYPACAATHMEVVPRSRDDGFDYDAVNNSIILYGSKRPALAGDIVVSYRYWIDNPQPPEGDPVCPCPETSGPGCACSVGSRCGIEGSTNYCDAPTTQNACEAVPGCSWNAGLGDCVHNGLCEPDPTCGGACPASTVCDPDLGICVCDVSCGGGCNPGQQCDDNVSVNACAGLPQGACLPGNGCLWDAAIGGCYSATCGDCLCDPTCGGGCPAGQECITAGPSCGQCACETDCGGACPNGTECDDGSACTGLGATACGNTPGCAYSAGVCFSPTCGFCQPRQCGNCGAGEVCDPGTGQCVCDATCGGGCPDGTECNTSGPLCGQCTCDTDCGGVTCLSGTSCDGDTGSPTCGLCVADSCTGSCNEDCSAETTESGCNNHLPTNSCWWAPWIGGGTCMPTVCQLCDSASGLCGGDPNCCDACGNQNPGGNPANSCNSVTGSCQCDTTCGGGCPLGTTCDNDPNNLETCGQCLCDETCGGLCPVGSVGPEGTTCDDDTGSPSCGLCVAALSCGAGCNALCAYGTEGACNGDNACRWTPWLAPGSRCQPVVCLVCTSTGACAADTNCCGACGVNNPGGNPADSCNPLTGACECDTTCGGGCPAGQVCQNDPGDVDTCGLCTCELDCGAVRLGVSNPCPTGTLCDGSSGSATCGLCVADPSCGVGGDCNAPCSGTTPSTCETGQPECRWAPWLNAGAGGCTPVVCANCNPTAGVCQPDPACCGGCGPNETCDPLSGVCECDTNCGFTCGPGLTCNGDTGSVSCGTCECDTTCGCAGITGETACTTAGCTWNSGNSTCGGDPCPTGLVCDDNTVCDAFGDQASCQNAADQGCGWDVTQDSCVSAFCGLCIVDPTCGGCPNGTTCNPSTGLCEPECPDCPLGQVCDPTSGTCVCDQTCGQPCPLGSLCDGNASSATCGQCVCDVTCGGDCPGTMVCDDNGGCSGLDLSVGGACETTQGCSVDLVAVACVSDTCGLCLIDETCGGSCPDGYTCDPVTGLCRPNQTCNCPPGWQCNPLTFQCIPPGG